MIDKIKKYLIIFSISFFILSNLGLSITFTFLTKAVETNFESQNCSSNSNLPINELNKQIKLYQHNYNLNLTRIISEMNLNILENGEDASISMQFTYYNSGDESVNYIIHTIDISTILIESRVSSILVQDAFGNLNYEWSFLGNLNLINISLRVPLNPQDFTSFSISYLLEDAIVSNPDITVNYILQWTLTFDEDIEQFSLFVTLPAQYELFNQSALEPIPNYQSSDGRRLEWDYFNILENQDQTWIIRFQDFVQEQPPISTFKPIFWISVVGTFLLGIIIGTIGMFYILRFKTDTERQEIVETLLSQPEKEIIKIIKKQDGVTTQSKIVDLSEFSKAKVSYYLTELEKKSIIMRERWGRMNRIRIIDDSVDKVFFSEDEKSETD
ncbi:MAG: hypothetical protein FK730_06780 [Asgard group archaeon]|nr:hypothetical protein [Asgard group archaeon]